MKVQGDKFMRKDVAFKTEDGITLRGWHYVPEERRGTVPTIVMAHGFSAVKEMYLDRFAEAFATAGLASIVFDNRNFSLVTALLARRSTRGSRSETTATRSHTPRRWKRPTRSASASGGPATAVAMFWWWARSTGG
jgi:cephalosporin-C deacetylase-like acetyl esterase